MKDFENINWLPVSVRFNQYLCSNGFKFFKETFPLYFYAIQATWSKSSKDEIFCFETKTSFKKHVFWSKKFVLSDNNTLEQFADGAEVGEFT